MALKQFEAQHQMVVEAREISRRTHARTGTDKPMRALLEAGKAGHVRLNGMLRGEDTFLADQAAAVLMYQRPDANILGEAMTNGPSLLRARCFQALSNAAVRGEFVQGTQHAWLQRVASALTDPEEVVSRAAARAAWQVAVSRGAGHAVNMRGMRLLIDALNHPALRTRSQAAMGLGRGWWHYAAVQRALIEHYATLDARARTIVLRAFGMDDEPNAQKQDLLLDALADTDVFVRVEALKALSETMQDEQRLTAILAEAMRSESGHVRATAGELSEALAERNVGG